MTRARKVRLFGLLVAALATVLFMAAPAEAGIFDELGATGASGSGTYTGTQGGNPVSGDISVELSCFFGIVCIGHTSIDGAGGFTIGLQRTPEAPWEFALSGLQINFGGEKFIDINVVSMSLASDGSFEWGRDADAISGQLDSGGFTIG